MKRIGEVLAKHWRGDFPPLTAALGTGLLIVLFGLAATRLLFALVLMGTNALKLHVVGEILVVVIWLAILIFVAIGILRSVHRATGHRLLPVSATLLGLVGLLGAFLYARSDTLEENWLILTDKDPVGEIASVEVRDGIIHLDGAITSGVAEKMEKAVDEVGKGARMVLTSEGGRLLEAYEIARIVRENELRINVPYVCTSACTNILIASPDSVMDVGAEIGFHRASVAGSDDAEERWLSDSEKDDMIELGIPAAFAEKVYQTPAISMWYPEVQELLDAGIVDTVDVVHTIADDADWINDSAPWTLSGDWLVVFASASERTLTMNYAFIPGSATAGERPDGVARTAQAARILCDHDFYRPILDHGGTIVMNQVDGPHRATIMAGDCPD